MRSRRGRQGGGPGRDDDREWQDLERFVAQAVEVDALEGFGLDPDEAADLLLSAPAGDPIDALAPRVASPARARAADALLRGLRAPALDRQAVAAAAHLASDCVRDGALPDHPFWEVYLAASLERALATGAVLDRLLLPELDPDWLAGAIGRALARDDARAALAVDNVRAQLRAHGWAEPAIWVPRGVDALVRWLEAHPAAAALCSTCCGCANEVRGRGRGAPGGRPASGGAARGAAARVEPPRAPT
ncbi:MAG: hypothetical protein KF878_10195 [Planctomycetes bacterium]|nr:hypothetical protein [Planctomycetota bacterium]